MLDEARRLRKLKSYGIMDTPPEPQFDDLALLVSKVCDAPIAIVSFADRTRHWYKARIGMAVREIAMDEAICTHALGGEDFCVIEDLRRDPRTAKLPLVIGEPYLRFYASVLLRTPDGTPVGTLCAVDHEPRPEGLTEGQREAMAALARHVMAILWLRAAVGERSAPTAPREWGPS